MAAPSAAPSVPQAVLDLPYFVQSPTIEQCRAAIKDASGFREVEKDDYVLFNYDFCFRGSFPDPRTAPTVEEALLRQTRRCVGEQNGEANIRALICPFHYPDFFPFL